VRFIIVSGSTDFLTTTPKSLFWLWLVILIVVNVIPLGNRIETSLTSRRFIFRLDYLIHALSFLVFGLIAILGRIANKPVFKINGFIRFVLLILITAVALEFIQHWIPYRTFNPWDMAGNLLGAVLAIVLVALTVKSAHALHHR